MIWPFDPKSTTLWLPKHLRVKLTCNFVVGFHTRNSKGHPQGRQWMSLLFKQHETILKNNKKKIQCPTISCYIKELLLTNNCHITSHNRFKLNIKLDKVMARVLSTWMHTIPVQTLSWFVRHVAMKRLAGHLNYGTMDYSNRSSRSTYYT